MQSPSLASSEGSRHYVKIKLANLLIFATLVAMITEKDVEYIAGLARLELTGEEKVKFQKDLGAILGFIDKLKELNVDGVIPTANETETANVMRADEPKSKIDPKTVENMLEQAPDRKDNFVKVKSILKK